MPFNKEQAEAIDASVNEDILISAGAGSGKTKTLTERVFRLIDKGEVAPSSLLVLTFTNNAAHEMKTRIISRFGKDSPKSAEMLSSHVQTFDSFNQYLVSTYSSRLGLSEAISVADPNVLATKEEEILDEIILRYYKNPEMREKVISFCQKFSLQGDSVFKNSILSFSSIVDKMTEEKKKNLLSNYDEHYLSDAFISSSYHEVVSSYKDRIKEKIIKAFFVESHHDAVQSENIDNVLQAFGSRAYWSMDINSFSFSEPNYSEKLYVALKDLLSLGDEEFVLKSKSFISDNEDVFVPRTKGLAKEDKKRLEAPWKILKETKEIFADVKELGSEADEGAKLRSFKDEIHLLFDTEEELRREMMDYKKSTNSFSFSDIAALSLSLLTEEKYADIAEEVRERFTYIMVDEYQDTNDFQELFLNSLLAPNKFGTRSHLFVVGDAKQSIYAFRNSNVALFRKREEEYLSGSGHKVIAMNKNYRSGEKLLSAINYLFSYYMRLDHGSIDYHDPSETLQYDENVDIYGKPFPNFGIHRILPPDAPFEVGDEKSVSSLPSTDFEAEAILSDIKKKIEEGYLVYERGKGIRPCRYSDFAILMRTKRAFLAYQKLFNRHGVKINNLITSDLREVDPIILIQSLLKLIKWKIYGGDEDVKHLFASVARSYAYQYDDEKVYGLISYKDPNQSEGHEPDDLLLIKQDPIYKALEEFVEENKNATLNDLFVKMLISFHVVDKLYLIGGVEEALAKIESLHQMIIVGSKEGEGLISFVKLFNDIDKYSLELEADSSYRMDDAVDMMSIHASKGLERKIVYLPVSLNVLTKGSAMNKPLFSFDEKHGFGFPYYSFDPLKSHEEDFSYSSPYRTLTDFISATKPINNPDVDEHVRLFYVALTRAENSIIIVGSPIKKAKETLYDMLDSCPHHPLINEELAQKKMREGVLPRNIYNDYLLAVDDEKKLAMPLSETDMDPVVFKAYEAIWQEFAVDYFSNRTKEKISIVLRLIYKDYERKLSDDLDNLNIIASLYSITVHPELEADGYINSLDALYRALQNKKALEEDDEEENDGGDDEDSEDGGEEEAESPDSSLPFGTIDANLDKRKLGEKIKEFASHIANEDFEFFHFHKGKKGHEWPNEVFDQFLTAFFSAFERVYDGGVGAAVSSSYESEGYEDHVSFFDPLYFKPINNLTPPDIVLPEINDTPLVFLPRVHERASKIMISDEDAPSEEALKRGVLLHHYLELVDLHTGDTSFITDSKDRAIIDKVLALRVMLDAKEASTYPEYGYFDEDLHTTGFIDLLFEKNGEFTIVDYKSSDIDDEAYPLQLRNYARNVCRLFKTDLSHIHLYLLSIMKGITKEVPVE